MISFNSPPSRLHTAPNSKHLMFLTTSFSLITDLYPSQHKPPHHTFTLVHGFSLILWSTHIEKNTFILPANVMSLPLLSDVELLITALVSDTVFPSVAAHLSVASWAAVPPPGVISDALCLIVCLLDSRRKWTGLDRKTKWEGPESN